MKTDNVNHPRHYEPLFFMREPECIDFTELMSFNRGNAFKYVWRSGLKGDAAKEIEDLEKAAWYCKRAAGKLDNDSLKNNLIRFLWSFVKEPGNNGPISKYYILDHIIHFNFDSARQLIFGRIYRLKKQE